MKKKLLSLLTAGCILSGANAQIVGPSTTTVGVPTSFSSMTQAFTYHWDFNAVTINPTSLPPLGTLFPAGSFSVPNAGDFVKDPSTGHYYYYSCEYNTGNLKCWDFGITFPSAPPASPVWTLGLGAGLNMGNIEVMTDGGGNWYGLIANSNNLIELNMGTNLGVAPAIAAILPMPNFNWPHQITIEKPDPTHGAPNWMLFVANRNGTMVRCDFGPAISSLLTPPAVTVLPNVGGVANPCNFTLYHQTTGVHVGWYALVTSLINNTVSLYDFGPSLTNIPTGTLLGSGGGLLNLPRAINIFPDCNGDLIALQFNEGGAVTKLDFAGDITNTPVFSSLGTTGTSSTSSCAIAATDNSFCYLLTNFSAGSISFFNPLIPLTVSNYCDYLSPLQTTSFPVATVYPISLFYDMGRPSGPSVDCSQIRVIDTVPCYDDKQTIMSVTQSTVDPCTFTACVSVATGNTITGYTWDIIPGGFEFTDVTSLPNDCFTFTLTPGTTFTIMCTVHIVDANLNCCTAILTQKVSCGGANPGHKSPTPTGTALENTAAQANDIQIYPNPTENMVYVSSANTGINTVQVFDVRGQKVKEFTFDGAKSTNVSLDKLPAGTYIFRVNNIISKVVSKTE